MSHAIQLQTTDSRAQPYDVLSIHAEAAGFVWLSLERFGVRAADLEDALQDVFVVVHRRLHTYDPTARLTTWLYGIAIRVAASYRRRAHNRREQLVAELPEEPSGEANPEDATAAAQARARLTAVLDLMDIDKRAIFVMFEIDGVRCEEIAEILGVPVGTVYSRLHAARKDFQAALARHKAREASLAAMRRRGDRA